jgi:sugar lactone lactonase YvrE
MFRKQLLSLSVAGAALFLLSCNGSAKKETTTDSSAVVVDSAAKPPVATAVQLWATDTVMKTPESVLFDKSRNVIYVANINGMPTDKDKNGFISKLTADGKVETLEWVKGLDAPKGMGIYQNKLYVTDISKIVEIDIEKGKIAKTYDVKGAQFLNDITVDSAGVVYFTDYGTSKIYTIIKGKLAVWLDSGLTKPNGLLIEKDRLLLADGNDFKAIDLATKAITTISSGLNAGDGIAYFGKPGHYVVSDWNGTVFLIEPDGTMNTIIDTKGDKINSADIDFITENSTLLVPTFFNNKVVAYTVTHNSAK